VDYYRSARPPAQPARAPMPRATARVAPDVNAVALGTQGALWSEGEIQAAQLPEGNYAAAAGTFQLTCGFADSAQG